MRYFLIVNPQAERRFPRVLPKLLAAAQNSILDMRIARDPDDFMGLAEKALREAYDYLLVFGGDGSLHLAIQAFGKFPGAKTVLIPLPLGTGNDFYRGLNGTTKLEDLGALFKKLARKRISLGRVSWEGGSRYFLNSLSLGITPRILAHYEKSYFRNYLLSTLNVLLSYRCLKLKISEDSRETLLLMICKGPFAGAGMRFHAEAGHDSVKLLWIPKLSPKKILRYLPSIYGSGLGGIPDVASRDFAPMEVEISEIEAKIEADGEIISVGSKIHLEIIPEALEVAYFTSD